MRPILRKTLNRTRWWALFNTAANFAYDLSNGRYMRSGGASTQALSLEETRASSAMVLQGNGIYVERAAGELAIGQGVGLQVSEEVVNLRNNSIQDGVVLGVHGVVGEIPDGWSLTKLGSGLTYEIIEIATLKGLPSFKLRVTGTASGSAQLYLRHGGATVGSIPALLGEFYAFNFFARLAAGSVNGINQAWMDNAIWNSGGIFQSRPTSNWREEFHVSNLDGIAKRYSVWVELEDVATAYIDPTINIKFNDGQVIDATFEFAGFNATAGAEERPIVIGVGSGATRAADNPVVVQGEGGVPWDGYDIAAGVTFQQTFDPSDTAGIEAFVFSDGTSDNSLTVRRGAGGGIEIEAYLAGVLTFSAESSTPFPTVLATIELYMEQEATVTVALDGVILSDLTQAGKALADYSQVSLACGTGTSTIKKVFGK